MNLCLLCVSLKANTMEEEECYCSARRTVDIGLNLSVIEHLTTGAGIPVLFPVQPYIFICLMHAFHC